MSWTDRVVEFPNRVKLTPVSGEADTYDMIMSEGDVTEEGTLLNAENLTKETNELIEAQLTGNIAPANFKCGVANFYGKRAADTVASQKITFDEPFATVPVVVATPQTTVPQKRSVAVGSITTTGFTLYWHSSTAPSGNNYVNWQAFAL